MSAAETAAALARALIARHQVPRAPHPMYEELPTLAAAAAMFAGNPGLSSVVTEAGALHRDGSLVFPGWTTAADRRES